MNFLHMQQKRDMDEYFLCQIKRVKEPKPSNYFDAKCITNRNLFLLLLTTNIAFAQTENVYAPVDTSKNFTHTSTINWIAIDENKISATCDQESRRRNLGGFKAAVEACSFWDGNLCTIFTPKITNKHTIGHEIQHCFQGNWHK